MAGPAQHATRALAIAAVIVATLAGGYLALVSYRQDRDLSVGTIRLSVSPGHKGALDVYVPLVDWGARFEAIRLPARLRADLRTIDRATVTRVAAGQQLDLDRVRSEARDGIAGYLKALIATTVAAAFALGLLTAFAVRSRTGPRLRWMLGTAAGTALVIGIGLVVLLPPRGEIAKPQYYAYGADIPRALDAAAAVQRASDSLEQNVDAQLVGLARLVTEPAGRIPVEGRPRITIASDLHNNVLAIPILERTAARGPVFFPGDLSDRGSPLESTLLRRVVKAGKPFVFVTGNHDSDRSARELAGDGAIVLTQYGRLKPGGGYGPIINRIEDLRVAGYSDPFERRAAEDYADRYQQEPTPVQQEEFAKWLIPLVGKVDVVLVHEPKLIAPALERIDPATPLVFVVGHTHKAELRHEGNVIEINGGSIGAGGTGNLADVPTKLGVARLAYDLTDGFHPLAADLVEIDPGTGAATARRERLDQPAPNSSSTS
jgi:predicted phosphodiesterase